MEAGKWFPEAKCMDAFGHIFLFISIHIMWTPGQVPWAADFDRLWISKIHQYISIMLGIISIIPNIKRIMLSVIRIMLSIISIMLSIVSIILSIISVILSIISIIISIISIILSIILSFIGIILSIISIILSIIRIILTQNSTIYPCPRIKLRFISADPPGLIYIRKPRCDRVPIVDICLCN